MSILHRLQWATKDQTKEQQDFENHAMVVRRMAELRTNNEALGGYFTISEHMVDAACKLSSVALEGLTKELGEMMEREIEARYLSLHDLIVLDQRLRRMSSIIDVLKQHVNDPKE